MYNVTLRRVRVKTSSVEKQYVLNFMSVCVYSCLKHPDYKVHAPYYIVICGLSGCTTFFNII